MPPRTKQLPSRIGKDIAQMESDDDSIRQSDSSDHRRCAAATRMPKPVRHTVHVNKARISGTLAFHKSVTHAIHHEAEEKSASKNVACDRPRRRAYCGRGNIDATATSGIQQPAAQLEAPEGARTRAGVNCATLDIVWAERDDSRTVPAHEMHGSSQTGSGWSIASVTPSQRRFILLRMRQSLRACFQFLAMILTVCLGQGIGQRDVPYPTFRLYALRDIGSVRAAFLPTAGSIAPCITAKPARTANGWT